MRILILILGIFATTHVLAADQCQSWGCITTISKLYTTANGPIYVSTPLDEKLANCTPVSDVYFTLDTSSKNVKEVYATLLAAYMAQKEVRLRIIEGSANCELKYVTLA